MHIMSLEIKKHFRGLKDPRRRHGRLHRLLGIVVIAVCAVTGGADNWEEIAPFGRRHQSWFRRYLTLPEGIPSHDTFSRVFSRLDAQVFQRCLRDWLLAFGKVLESKHIAVDGKFNWRFLN